MSTAQLRAQLARARTHTHCQSSCPVHFMSPFTISQSFVSVIHQLLMIFFVTFLFLKNQDVRCLLLQWCFSIIVLDPNSKPFLCKGYDHLQRQCVLYSQPIFPFNLTNRSNKRDIKIKTINEKEQAE